MHTPCIAAALGRLVPALTIVAVVSCSRSEDVGWSGREMPDSVGPDTAVATAVAGEYREEEYERLATELKPLLTAAMASEELQARYQDLIADVEARVAEKSTFYRGLMERREEIEARFAEANETGQAMSEEERGRLAYHYRNIQYEMRRVRDSELGEEEFADRFWEFKLALFEAMRELAPQQAADVDRLQEFEKERPPEIAPPFVTGTNLRPPQ